MSYQIIIQMIGLYLSDYTFSSALPDSFNITGVQGEYVEVDVSLEGQSIYSTKLYKSSNNTCTFYELRQIVEQNMVVRGLTLASLLITVDYGGEADQFSGKYIIYSKNRKMDSDDEGYLANHFLMNRTSYTLPRGQMMILPFFATDDEYIRARYSCTFLKNGEAVTYQVTQSIYQYQTPHIYNLYLTADFLQDLAEQSVGDNCGQLLCFTVRVGDRSLTVYIVDEEPCVHLSFRNSFNTWEEIYVFGSETLKTEVSHKEAVVMNTSSFYDNTVSRKHEVVTVPLSQEEARWINEFLESDEVIMEVSHDYPEQPVLISDITSEISDSAKEHVRIKFSWRFNDQKEFLR